MATLKWKRPGGTWEYIQLTGEDVLALRNEFDEHKADYALFKGSSEIVETGTNENGSYVRWANGLQICYRSWNEQVNANSALSLEWTHPAIFTISDDPAAGLMEIYRFYGGGVTGELQDRISLGYNMLQSLNTAMDSVLIINNHHTSALYCRVYALAIGRWK